MDFKVHNNTGAAIPDYSFVFNWKGVSNVIMWSGMDVVQNGNNGIVELKKTTWGNVLPVGTSTYSVTMDYVLGMFPPGQGALNGTPIKGITCYTPPATENFKCEKSFSSICAIKPTGPEGHEIKIGEGSVWAWGERVDVYIPENRKGWAIGMAVSHSLFTNLMGFDAMSINEYFATTIQEINAGCEGSKLIAPAWVTKKYPNQDLINGGMNCYDTTGRVAAGYFQQEMGGSWMEMFMNYPCFIPQVPKNSFISDPAIGASFEFQSIVKTYHDYRNIAFWQYVKCWNPIGFLKDSKDPYAAVKILALAYNQGMNSGAFEPVFVRDRTAALAATNLMDYISPASPSGLDRLYAEQINRLTKVLDNRIADISWTDAAIWNVTDKSAHSFRGFYDSQIAWSDVEAYIKKITPFYAVFGVTEANFIAAVKPVFDRINGGNSISFRYQMHDVVEAIVVFLPAFDPKKGLSEVYGNESNGCFAPTARMEGFDGGCGKELGLTVYFSGKPPYKFTYKRTDVSPEVVYPEITTSQNPYAINSASLEEGTYAIVAISDANAAGEVVCEPIEIKNVGVALSAKLVKEGGGACTGTGAGIKVEISGTGSGPFTIEYEKDGVAQPVVTVAGSSPILVPSPAPKGTYKLTKISASGCNAALDDSLVIDDTAAPTSSAQLVKYREVVCTGTIGGVQIEITSTESGPFTIEYEKDGLLQPPVTVTSSPHILIPSPAPKGTYKLTKITSNSCDFPLSSTLIIDDLVVVKVKIEGNLFFCKQAATVLDAVADPVSADIDSYQWIRNNANLQGADKKTYNAGQEGDYSVKITDKNGCVSESPIVKVTEKCPDGSGDPKPDPVKSDYPKFFTPNGDGHNDTWHFKNFDKYKKAEIRIFDRYGKFIIQLSEHSPGWDGTNNNNPLFATDYWFVMTYEDPDNLFVQKTYRGHFSLKR